MKIFNAILSGFLFSKAINFASRMEYKKAMRFLNLSDRFCPNIYSHYLLRSHIMLVNENFYECEKNSRKAIELIHGKKKLNIDEKKYLNVYALDLINLSIVHGKLEQDLCIIELDFSLKNIDERLIRYFPIMPRKRAMSEL